MEDLMSSACILEIRLEDLQKEYWQTPCWAGGKKPDSRRD